MNYPPDNRPGTPPNYTPTGQPGSGPTSTPVQGEPRMVPVRRPVTRPTVTYALLGITFFCYLLQVANQNGMLQGPFLALAQLMFNHARLDQLINEGWGRELPTLVGGKINELIAAGQYWRLLTPALLHASLEHIGFNMYALFVFGTSVEGFYGHRRFLGLYVLGALGGNVLSFLFSPYLSVGASTAIFALIAAEAIFFYQNRAIFGSQARSMLVNAVIVIVANLGFGLASNGIDNFGHLGGLLTGLAFGWFVGPQFKVAYQPPDYVLADQRPPALAWVMGLVITLFLLGLAFWGIMTYSGPTTI